MLHGLLLEAILKDNPIPLAYRMNYIANFYVGPLVAMMEKSFKLTRSEWIVLFCLTRQPRLNAQQISIVTGRPENQHRERGEAAAEEGADHRARPISPTAAGACFT